MTETPTTITVAVPETWLESSKRWAEGVAAQGATSILSEEQAKTAAQMVTDLVRFKKRVEDERSSITSGAYKTIKAIEARFRPLLKQIDEARKQIEKQLLDYRAAEERARAVALAAARSMAPQVTDLPAVRAYQEVVAYGAQAQEAAVAGVRFKRIWRARVVNPALVPAPFWAINQTMLDDYAAQHEDRAFLPGVEFYTEETIGQVRTK